MQVERDRVVRFHYEIRDAAGGPVESWHDGEPAAVLYGHGDIVPGLERALAGRAAGDRFEVRVAPEEGYGARREGRVRRVQKKHLVNARRLRPGMEIVVDTELPFCTATALLNTLAPLTLNSTSSCADASTSFWGYSSPQDFVPRVVVASTIEW